MSWFSSWLHPGRGYDEAADQVRQAQQQAQGFEMPFSQAGQSQISNLQQAIQAMLNPQGLQSKWLEGYETSPYAKQLMGQSQASGMDAASAMGLGGSSAALHNIQQSSSNIMQADRQQYLNDLMQKYMGGVSTAQSMFGTGANMAGKMGDQSLQTGDKLAELSYGKNAASGQMFSQVAKMLPALIASFAGGGGFPGFDGMSSDMYGGS